MRAITIFEAASILGCTPLEARKFVEETPTLDDLEVTALERYPWRARVDDPNSYWVTVKQAACILGVSIQRVKQYLDQDQVPFAVHRDGTRLMRREQLETVANARFGRRLQERFQANGADPSGA